MLSFIPDLLLKPVAAMTNKCGLSFYQYPSADTSSTDTSKSNCDNQTRIKETKLTVRAVSSASTVCGDGSDSARSHFDDLSDEEVCRRMAILGKSARKAGRHILAGNRLVLS